MVVVMWIYLGAFSLAAWIVWHHAKQYDAFLQQVWEQRKDARPALRRFFHLPEPEAPSPPDPDASGNSDADDI